MRAKIGARAHRRIALALAVLMGGAAVVLAQEVSDEVPAGTVLTLDISETLRFNDNLGLDETSLGSTTRSDTALTFGLLSETRTQSLAVTLGGILRVEDAPISGTTAEFVDPNATLSYTREGANARLSFDGSFVQSELDSLLTVFDPDLGRNSLAVDTGTRSSYRFSGLLELGQNGPLGFSFEARTSGTLYQDTLDPDLFDSRTNTGIATVSLAFSPVTEGTAQLSFSSYDAEDAPRTQRDTVALSFGLEHLVASGLTVEASLGGRRIDDSVDGLSDGGEARLGVSQELSNGQISAELSRSFTTVGRVDRLSATRQLEFPTWDLSASLGVVDVEGLTTDPTFDLRYARAFKRGELSAALSSDVSISNESEANRVLTGSVNYTHLLTDVSLVRFGVSATDVQDAGGTSDTDLLRSSIDVTYERELARDWTFSAGVSWQTLDDAGVSGQDHSVFVNLDRRLSLLP